MREQGGLNGGNVAEAEQQGLFFAHTRRQARPIDVRQQTRRTVAAAHAHQHFRGGRAPVGDVLQIGDAFGIAAGKTLETAVGGLVVAYRKACLKQAVQPRFQARRVFGIARAGKQAQGVFRTGGALRGLRRGCVDGVGRVGAGWGNGNGFAAAARAQQAASHCRRRALQQTAARENRVHQNSFSV